MMGLGRIIDMVLKTIGTIYANFTLKASDCTYYLEILDLSQMDLERT
jgi:hypothetical protein